MSDNESLPHDATSLKRCATDLVPREEDADKPAKRPRNANMAKFRSSIDKQAKSFRKQGISTQTLFIPSLPASLLSKSHLCAAIGPHLTLLKTVSKNGNTMAWATFSAESHCIEAMHLLKTSHPNLKLSLHRPKLPDAVDLQRVRQSEALFDTRLPQIVAKGGIGNTLLFRGLPEETTCEEFQSILCQFVSQLHGASSPACRPLRMRFAPAREKGRNFWAVYASVDVCRAAFVSVNVCVASFRCGKCVTLHPVVHNDAKDVDEKKRRDRSVALDDQFSKAARPAYVNVERKVDSVELLHSFLRQTQDTFVFMSEADV